MLDLVPKKDNFLFMLRKIEPFKNFSLWLSDLDAYVSFLYISFFLIGIHSMQGWTATTREEVTRKKA